MKNAAGKRSRFIRVFLCTAMAVAWMFGALGAANAFKINTGNPDVDLSWDNAIRYNLGVRVQSRDNKIGNTANSDEGDYKFNTNDVVTNRLDLMSELNFGYKRQVGFRLSGAGWFDAAYNSDVMTNPTLAGRSSYTGDKYSDRTKRYHIGPEAEVLDANIWGNFNVGSMPVNLVGGRQTVLWGEAVVLSGHSVSYSQGPQDAIKALSTPGADARELMRPTNQVMGTIAVTSDLVLAAQYYMQWEQNRLPEGGTYLAATDFILEGPDRLSLAPGLFLSRRDMIKGNDYGNFGVSARWSPKWLDGTLGVYYRKYDETNPWVSIDLAQRTYRAIYATGVEIYGISLAKQLLGLSFGTEVSFRSNGALNSTITNGSVDGARGDTVHVLVNAIGSYGPNPAWDGLAVIAELAYSTYTQVRSKESLFNVDYLKNPGVNTAAYGCATKNNLVGYLRFSPSWVQVMPGWDFDMSMSISYGLVGNGATLGGGNEGAGSYGIGVSATYDTFHTWGLAYAGYLATYKDNGVSITASNGSQLQDRGWLSLTYKYAF